MIVQVIKCDRCENEIARDGFSMNSCSHIYIYPGIDYECELHYCGKECLMLALNAEVEKIKGAPAAATAEAR